MERPAADLGKQAGESFQRYLSDGRPYDLDAAIELWEKAAQRSDAASPDLGDHLGMLGIALRMRFERTENRSDLDGALEAEAPASPAPRKGRPTWPCTWMR